MTKPPTKEAVNTFMVIILAVAETVREMKETPSGPIYAALMEKYPSMTLDYYQDVLSKLKGACLIKESHSGSILTWIGPNDIAKEAKA